MAEYKHYITQAQENGNVMISEDVIATIVEHAITEVEGVAYIGNKAGSDIKKNWSKGMKIAIAEDNSVAISVNIVIRYGYSVVDVSANVQTVLTNAVESMTGVEVTKVNVNVCGIHR